MFHFVLLSVCKAVWKLSELKQTKSQMLLSVAKCQSKRKFISSLVTPLSDVLCRLPGELLTPFMTILTDMLSICSPPMI